MASSEAKILFWIFFSSYQNWAICYTRRYPKCTWTSKDSVRKDYETGFTEDSKKWSQHWWYDNNGWFHRGWNLVREQTSRWLHAWVTIFCSLIWRVSWTWIFESSVVLCLMPFHPGLENKNATREKFIIKFWKNIILI